MPQRKKDSDEPTESLAKKLGVKQEGMAIALLWAPDGFAKRIGMEDGNYDTDLTMGTFDLIIFFTASRVLLREFFPIAIDRLEPDGKLWICWPKKAEGQKNDVTTDIIQTLAEPLELIETNRNSIDETWTGIKFKKGVVSTTRTVSALGSIAPYSISITSSIPITSDE